MEFGHVNNNGIDVSAFPEIIETVSARSLHQRIDGRSVGSRFLDGTGLGTFVAIHLDIQALPPWGAVGMSSGAPRPMASTAWFTANDANCCPHSLFCKYPNSEPALFMETLERLSIWKASKEIPINKMGTIKRM